MFQAGTRGGPIGVEEYSLDLVFIMDKITKRKPDISTLHPKQYFKKSADAELLRLIELQSVTEKYMFEDVNVFILRLIARYAHQSPRRALAFACNAQPSDGTIAKAALESFKNRFTGPWLWMKAYFVAHDSAATTQCYSPAADNLQRSYVVDEWGVSKPTRRTQEHWERGEEYRRLRLEKSRELLCTANRDGEAEYRVCLISNDTSSYRERMNHQVLEVLLSSRK